MGEQDNVETQKKTEGEQTEETPEEAAPTEETAQAE